MDHEPFKFTKSGPTAQLYTLAHNANYVSYKKNTIFFLVLAPILKNIRKIKLYKHNDSCILKIKFTSMITLIPD